MDKDKRTYIRLHDGMPDHPKVDPLSDKAFRLIVESWCWCSRHLTDGRMPLATWRKRGTAKARAELAAAGLAVVDGEAVIMHDYLEHQRSAAEVELVKEKRRAAGRIGGLAKANGLANASDDAKQTDSNSFSKRGSKNVAPYTETEAETEKRGGEGRGTTSGTRGLPEPPAKCPKHLNDIDPPNCGACGDARKARQCWETERWEASKLDASERAHAIAEANAAAISACGMCDDRGYRTPTEVCDHDPETPGRRAAGIAAAKAAAARRKPVEEQSA